MVVWNWNTSFLLGWPIFRCCVSFREGILGLGNFCFWGFFQTSRDDVWDWQKLQTLQRVSEAHLMGGFPYGAGMFVEKRNI